ncbi:MAG: hypothetical protein QM650_00330 [Microlunatus sp.]
MNSATAMVELDGGLFMAKWVPGGGAKSLDSGSKAARRLALGGLASGEPLETLGGGLSWPALDGAVVEPWVRPAVTAVLDEHARIDWTGSVRGPVLYDVASALMYLGGPDQAEDFLRVYVRNGRRPLTYHPGGGAPDLAHGPQPAGYRHSTMGVRCSVQGIGSSAIAIVASSAYK